jgi:D-alanyl-D-alanine endopeptidase (penicillin-binding protein 7)
MRLRQFAWVNLCLAIGVFVLFSTNRVIFVEGSDSRVEASESTPDYILDFANQRPKAPRLQYHAAILVNFDNGEVIYSKNAEMVHSIASISKLVAAMVVLDSKPNLTDTATISKEDAYQSSKSHLRAGWQLSLHDLLYASLMISDNRSTRTLARTVAGSLDSFVVLMNAKVKSLGLKNTVFYDPTGLDSRNVSTAHELAIVLYHASRYPMITRITSENRYYIHIINRRNRILQLANTNRLMRSPYTVLAGKTGYIQESAYCLATLLKNREGEKLALVLLGAPGGNLRFKEARILANWGFRQM